MDRRRAPSAPQWKQSDASPAKPASYTRRYGASVGAASAGGIEQHHYRCQVLTPGLSERREDEAEGLRERFDFKWQRSDRLAVEFHGHLRF